MSTKPPNPWAFPASGHPGKQFLEQEGMSLRDYFAAAALTGLASGNVVGNMQDVVDGYRGGQKEAKAAYELADAMLRARG